MANKELLQISDTEDEFLKIQKKIQLFERGFYAISADYHHYIDNSWSEKNIQPLREGVSYRIFSANFHLRLFLLYRNEICMILNLKYKNDNTNKSINNIETGILFEKFEKEISSLFESIIYHLVSVFDYISTLIAHICDKKNGSDIKYWQLKSYSLKSTPFKRIIPSPFCAKILITSFLLKSFFISL